MLKVRTKEITRGDFLNLKNNNYDMMASDAK